MPEPKHTLTLDYIRAKMILSADTNKRAALSLIPAFQAMTKAVNDSIPAFQRLAELVKRNEAPHA